ncbi:DivIVA domain-containing protein [Patulibacter sp. SYSU D01012]|uniref:DivIVA domain-containing protein n=1 Tax=Patulibacter sp. SYSU D01012 TaxID=2817381 RepID=UPI001B3119CB
MPTDRQSIEKRDFPIARRGYETHAVDEHLRRLADEVEALRAERDAALAAAAAPAPAPASASLAAGASERVRRIVAAAEETAESLERDARDEADRVRADAEHEARERVSAVRGATTSLLQRVAALDAEVGRVLEDLGGEVPAAVAGSVSPESRHVTAGAPDGGLPTPEQLDAPAAPVVEPDPEPAPAPAASSATPPAAPDPVPSAVAGPAPTTPPTAAPAPAATTPPAERSTDEAGARLVALDLLLDGTPREEIDRRLAERYALPDRAGLLDELYARQG